MIRYLFIIFALNICLSVNSQLIREFTADTLVYIEEIKKFTSNYISADEAKILDNFINVWQSGGFTWPEMNVIVENSTKLVRKNGRASPHFISYFELLTILFSEEYSGVGRKEWENAISFFLSDKNTGLRSIDAFLKSSANLLKNNDLFNLPGNTWKGLNPKYRFLFQDDEIRVVFESFDMVCYSKRDSIIIFGTSGWLDLIENIWHGFNGTVKWERANLSGEKVYAKLGNYNIDLKRSEYTADSVEFYYKDYFDTPLLGRLEDKVMQITEPVRATHPKFFSYQNKYILPDLFSDIEYIGGLSMQGSRLIGTGSVVEPAVLNIFDQGMLRLRIESRQLLFSAASVNSPSVQITMYLENDSLYHPDLQLNFSESNNEIRFTKSRNFTSATPYTNTYHEMDMNFEELSWRRNERIIRFRPLTGTSIGIASFESHSFFNNRVFEELQGMDRINPLVALWQFGRMINMETFSLPDYARYLGMAAYQVRQQLMRLSRLGFVYYEEDTDQISLKPKLFYFLESSVGNVDYDVILFSSRVDAPMENAQLDLDNLDLTINGVQHISISDSQNVVLLPQDNRIIMKRNKSFQFDGTVYAGLFSFFGNNFYFDYENFKINMQEIDSVGIAVQSEKIDDYGRVIAEKVNNLLQNATGELLIDDPQNKSGLESFPQYPTFISRENSYVYFDEKAIQNGVYKRDAVYFEADPFTLDSLDNFNKDGLQLTGRFISGGILPPLDQTLVIMPDNSLGFTHVLPEQGIPVFNGKGTFYQEIQLSNRGIRGAGKLEYLTSTTFSDDFTFHPDSLMVQSRDFMIEKQIAGVEFPGVKSRNNPVKWLAHQDKFLAGHQDIPFTIFEDTIRLTGDILLQPTGLYGNGVLDMISASLSSEKIHFKAEALASDSANFQLKSPSTAKLAISTNNVNAKIDFKNMEGEFIPNEGYALVEFPENRYISSLDYFLWLMDEQQLHMGMDKPLETLPSDDGLMGPRYISIHPDQDSLSFVSPIAVYDYNSFIIKATDVPYIQVADARVYPSDGLLVVEPNAKIRTLSEATIIADYRNEYFRLYDAQVNITGKYKYNASARYDYTDYTGIIQTIDFAEISVDTARQTFGRTEITLLDSFTLSPHFMFQGRVNLRAQSRNMEFDGAARTVHVCNVGRGWIKFKAEIDPENVLIPVSEAPLDINLNRIFAGIMLTRDSSHVYTTFGSGRKDYFDNYIANASGFLRFNVNNQSYEIAGLQKLSNPLTEGNLLKLSTFPCETYSEGEMDFLVDYGQVKMNAYGTATHDMEEDSFSSDVLLTFDFLFSKDALTVFAADLDSLTGLNPYDLTNPVYNLAIREIVGERASAIMASELSLYGNYRNFPAELNKTLILSNIKLKWNMNTRSFRHHGLAGVVRIGDRQINKEAEIYIELSKRASGDLLDIYFVMNDNTWYYFGYNPGSLQVTSSNREFNEIVFNLRDNQRRLNVRSGETEYIYALAPDRRAELFIRRFLEEVE
jgi:hypothetical protein